MKIDTVLGDVVSAAQQAKDAEAAGYDGLFTAEMGNDPFLPLALAATVTERIELGTSIAVAFARSPMTVAYTAWDLQRLTQGRFVLGLGSQIKTHINRRFDMPWGKPAAQMRDYVRALQAIWNTWSTGEPLKFESEHYTHTLMTPMFSPPTHGFGNPQVYIAGVGEAMSRAAGEVADGFICHTFTTKRWIEEKTLPAIAEGRARAGKTMEGFTVGAPVFVATGTDEQITKTVEAIKLQLAFYASTPAYQGVLDLHGWGEIGPELNVLSKQGKWVEMGGLITDEILNAFAVIAAPDDLAGALNERCRGIVDRIAFYDFLGDPPKDVLAAAAAKVRAG
ncbi:MAG TPA: TIGR03617 family F420-dependent LLM class oxidoreductase [Jatrophihabitans sp.]